MERGNDRLKKGTEEDGNRGAREDVNKKTR